MNSLAQLGKRKTLILSGIILLASIFNIYFYHTIKPNLETKKIIQQIIRIGLTALLLYRVYLGKKNARIITIILFLIGLILLLSGLRNPFLILIHKSPIILMGIVYLFALHHFIFAKSFKEFYNYQNGIETEDTLDNDLDI